MCVVHWEFRPALRPLLLPRLPGQLEPPLPSSGNITALLELVQSQQAALERQQQAMEQSNADLAALKAKAPTPPGQAACSTRRRAGPAARDGARVVSQQRRRRRGETRRTIDEKGGKK